MDETTPDPRGELVRPYSVTRGRTKPADHIAVEAILQTTGRGWQEAPFAGRDKQAIADLCRAPLSLAEIAAHTAMPLGVVRVLVADMTNEGMLILHTPTATEAYDERMDLLERVLDGLRRL